MDAKMEKERAEMDRMVQQQRDDMDRMIQQKRDDMDQRIQLNRVELDMKMRKQHAAEDWRLKLERVAVDKRIKQDRENMYHVLKQEREHMDRDVKQEREIADQTKKLERVQMDITTMEARAEMDQRMQHKSDDIDRKAVLPTKVMTEKSQETSPPLETHNHSIPKSRPGIVIEFIIHKGFSGAEPGTMTFVEPTKVEWWSMMKNLACQGYKGNTDLYYLKPGYEPPNGLVLLYCSEQVEQLLRDHEGRKTCHLYIVKRNATTSTSDDTSSEHFPSYDPFYKITSEQQTRSENMEDQEHLGGYAKRSKMDPTDAD